MVNTRWCSGLGVLAWLAALSLGGCSGDDITDPGQIVFPATNVSFSAHVQPYLNLSCNITGCHDAARPSTQGIVLTSWIGVRASNVTWPGDTTSPILLVMKGMVVHSGVVRTNANQRAGVQQWVKEGALNN